MTTWTFQCWACGNASEMIDKVAHAEVCPHCGVEMHSCKNCEHWDPDRPDRCCDESYPYAHDLERANYSSRFTPRRSRRSDADDGVRARARLRAIFEKAPARGDRER